MQNNHGTRSFKPRARQLVLIHAGVAQKFGGLLIFFATILLGVGGYQLVQAVAHPLDAQPSEVIASAVLITLAFIMLFHVIEAQSAWYASRRAYRRHRAHTVGHSMAIAELLVHERVAMNGKLPFAPVNGDRETAGYTRTTAL